MPSLTRSVPKPLKVPSLAHSVQKPLKVPSLARSVPKPLSIFVVSKCMGNPGRGGWREEGEAGVHKPYSLQARRPLSSWFVK